METKETLSFDDIDETEIDEFRIELPIGEVTIEIEYTNNRSYFYQTQICNYDFLSNMCRLWLDNDYYSKNPQYFSKVSIGHHAAKAVQAYKDAFARGDLVNGPSGVFCMIDAKYLGGKGLYNKIPIDKIDNYLFHVADILSIDIVNEPDIPPILSLHYSDIEEI